MFPEKFDGKPVTPFKAPPGVQQAEVCSLSGMLPTQECRENSLPIHGVRQDWFVPGINLPAKPDDWHQKVDVCKLNGKRSTPLVPDNARDSVVYVTLPEAASRLARAETWIEHKLGEDRTE